MQHEIKRKAALELLTKTKKPLDTRVWFSDCCFFYIFLLLTVALLTYEHNIIYFRPPRKGMPWPKLCQFLWLKLRLLQGHHWGCFRHKPLATELPQDGSGEEVSNAPTQRQRRGLERRARRRVSMPLKSMWKHHEINQFLERESVHLTFRFAPFCHCLLKF